MRSRSEVLIAGGVCTAEAAPVFGTDPSIKGEDLNLDGGSGVTRCPVKIIHDVVVNLDFKKRELVKSIGFGGMLYFPCIKQLNRKLSIGLMSSVDAASQSLVLPGGVTVKFCNLDVKLVFGIPCSGKKVLDSSLPVRKSKHNVIERHLGAGFKEHRSIKLVLEIVQRQYDDNMSEAEQDAFRVAFVVFVVSTLFCPAAKHDYASIDYWSAIEVPDEIGSYDWCEYVLRRMCDAVGKLKQDVSSGIKSPNLTGCSLFLQVLYLDSLDLGSLSMAHSSFPRARDFCQERLRMMVRAEPCFRQTGRSPTASVIPKLRDHNTCCYTWAAGLQPPDIGCSRSASLLAVFESAVAMARLLNIPMESAGPLFVAATDFQHQVDSGVPVTGMRAIKYMTVLLSIMLSFKSGYSYQFSADQDAADSGSRPDFIGSVVSSGIRLLSVPMSKKRKSIDSCAMESDGARNGTASHSGGCSDHPLVTLENRLKLHHKAADDCLRRSMNQAIATMQHVPVDLNTNCRLASVMSQFYCMARRMNLTHGFDLNAIIDEHSQPLNIGPVLTGPAPPAPPSPWSIGFSWNVIECNGETSLSRITSCHGDHGFIIIHRCPRTIKVYSSAFRSQIIGTSEFELDMFDAFVRRLRQEDDLLYKDFPRSRWRHVFESDFMVYILSGSFAMADSTAPNPFLHHLMPYDIRSCKLLFFPALLQFRWVCYVWSTERNVIRVFDPSFAVNVPEHTMELHERNCYLLKLAMYYFSRTISKEWPQDWMTADVQITTWPDRSFQWENRTGLSCAVFCACFDGEDLHVDPKTAHAEGMAAKVCEHIMKLDGNSGDSRVLLP